MIRRLCSNKVEVFYQYFVFIFSMACSCSELFFLANFSIAESGTPPRVEANCVKNQSFIGLLRPTLPMNFWMPYLKLCCQVLYMTPSFPGSIVLPMSKKSDFSRSPIGTKVSLVVVKTHNECECWNPVVLIECLNGRLDHPVPLIRLVWGELAVCVLANEPYAASLETALDANVVIGAGSHYLR